MSKFEIDDEAVIALWDRLAAELDHLTLAYNRPHCALEVVRSHFFDVLANGGGDIFECVVSPASRAGKYTVGVRISRTFKLDVTRTALGVQNITRH